MNKCDYERALEDLACAAIYGQSSQGMTFVGFFDAETRDGSRW